MKTLVGPTAKRRQAKKSKEDRAYAAACLLVDRRDGGRCRACGQRMDHHHHIRPRSLSARDLKHSTANLVSLCATCHDHVHRGIGIYKLVIAGDADRILMFEQGGVVRHG